MSDDEGWEARMAARARAREAAKAEAADAELGLPAGELLWLNGWPRLNVRTVLMGTEVRCVCCGRTHGITCVVFEPDWEPPGPEPEWPFTEADCPNPDCKDWSSTWGSQAAGRL